mmetsp:Transcript_7646/g.11355  ORF Transcript_7646/g.11355 Transcript_7646/m.11355 type:complete len:151 (-) Transcript_7646:679-1131(-)
MQGRRLFHRFALLAAGFTAGTFFGLSTFTQNMDAQMVMFKDRFYTYMVDIGSHAEQVNQQSMEMSTKVNEMNEDLDKALKTQEEINTYTLKSIEQISRRQHDVHTFLNHVAEQMEVLDKQHKALYDMIHATSSESAVVKDAVSTNDNEEF